MADETRNELRKQLRRAMSDIKYKKDFTEWIPFLTEWQWIGDNNKNKDYFESNIEYMDIKTIPAIENVCLCDHSIKYNHYIIHRENKNVFVVGSCCAKKFGLSLKKIKRCLECKTEHNRRKNFCKNCQFINCRICKQYHDREKVCKLITDFSDSENDEEYSSVIVADNKNKLNKQCEKCLSDINDESKCKMCNVFMNFGKYKNKTYSYVYDNDKSYCKWIINNHEGNIYKIVSFIKYVRRVYAISKQNKCN